MRHSVSLTAAAAALALVACHGGGLTRNARTTEPAVDRSVVSAKVVAANLEFLQKLAQGAAADQAELLSTAQHEFDLAPTPSHQLRLALALGAFGYAGTDLPRAQRLLREVLAAPETLLPGERSLALVQLRIVDTQLSLSTENRRLQDAVSREDREKLAALNRRLQTETDENARLRKELEEARAKLDAIANIERSLNERKPKPEGRSP